MLATPTLPALRTKRASAWCATCPAAERATLVARLGASRKNTLGEAWAALTCRALKDQSTIASYLRLVQRSSRIAGRARMGLSSSTMPSSYDPQTLVETKLALRDTAVVFSKTY